jgi:hypothetical protein
MKDTIVESNIKSGLYIVKCYWKNTRTNQLIPVLKFGYTSNIDTRMYHYNKKSSYKLLYFAPCKGYLKEREGYIKEYGCDEITYHCRCSLSEHMMYEKGLFKKMYNDVFDASKIDIKTRKNNKGVIVTTYGD